MVGGLTCFKIHSQLGHSVPSQANYVAHTYRILKHLLATPVHIYILTLLALISHVCHNFIGCHIYILQPLHQWNISTLNIMASCLMLMITTHMWLT